ncbi:hypothetical protein AAGU66_01410 [Edwardsiella ictaluri]|uniref:Uncharacterized protein n=2 Tax=Edwardsiella ictaluri TaxID=67780 RepID=C5BCU0_EDWI9|nr:hypothetical protein [Edwardsiella ictaluri]ACR67546.1 hypothetical protein NT01EI_0304 [Edwardsiella ictaluri 93-146]UYB62034.1 hypothetical protein N8I66_01795 [Edwardsiella ictaluri]UYB65260.1 hypothetical protein N8I67_01795 [Edwardsiella ictaluri]BEH97610.1 hypothetical protein KH20906_03380 [Edwardsiella ictaluri]BEI01077.1 hypothetical protein KB20921_03380 [Edwardsiella ictaluri]
MWQLKRALHKKCPRVNIWLVIVFFLLGGGVALALVLYLIASALA